MAQKIAEKGGFPAVFHASRQEVCFFVGQAQEFSQCEIQRCVSDGPSAVEKAKLHVKFNGIG